MVMVVVKKGSIIKQIYEPLFFPPSKNNKRVKNGLYECYLQAEAG